MIAFKLTVATGLSLCTECVPASRSLLCAFSLFVCIIAASPWVDHPPGKKVKIGKSDDKVETITIWGTK